MSEATLNMPNLEQINKDLADTVVEEMEKNTVLTSAIQKALVQMEACGNDTESKTKVLCEFCFGKVQRTLKDSLTAGGS
jgi:hypothetical protein